MTRRTQEFVDKCTTVQSVRERIDTEVKLLRSISERNGESEYDMVINLFDKIEKAVAQARADYLKESDKQ